MTRIQVYLAREGRGWRIAFGVNSNVEPTHVFGCTDGMKPLIAGLIAAEAEANTVSATPEANAGGTPPTVTVRMPSGRVLTFSLSSMQETLTEHPQGIPG